MRTLCRRKDLVHVAGSGPAANVTGLIQALVFDFDGLILETELPVFQSWQQTYAEHGVELPFDIWLETIGTAHHEFDPFDHLQTLVGRQIEREPLQRRRKLVRDAILHAQDLLPGVRDYIRDAQDMGLKLGIASSSSRAWVMGHLTRLGIDAHWDAVRTADDVSRTKPDPELYQLVVADLGAEPATALALEDSENGVTAAKAAGLWCVAVPGPLTAGMDFSGADLVLDSLEARPLPELVEELGARS
jgi:HAD superfamily hydrolase (TIGR01509 family)